MTISDQNIVHALALTAPVRRVVPQVRRSRVMEMLLLGVSVLLACVHVATADGGCPAYDAICSRSVGSEFSMKSLEGEWFIMATTEPTVPKFCGECGWLNFRSAAFLLLWMWM